MGKNREAGDLETEKQNLKVRQLLPHDRKKKTSVLGSGLQPTSASSMSFACSSVCTLPIPVAGLAADRRPAYLKTTSWLHNSRADETNRGRVYGHGPIFFGSSWHHTTSPGYTPSPKFTLLYSFICCAMRS